MSQLGSLSCLAILSLVFASGLRLHFEAVGFLEQCEFSGSTLVAGNDYFFSLFKAFLRDLYSVKGLLLEKFYPVDDILHVLFGRVLNIHGLWLSLTIIIQAQPPLIYHITSYRTIILSLSWN